MYRILKLIIGVSCVSRCRTFYNSITIHIVIVAKDKLTHIQYHKDILIFV